MFEVYGVVTDASLSGTNAIELITKRIDSKDPLYKLILLDYSMPEKDGP